VSAQGWVETPIVATSAGGALSSFTTAVSALPTAARYKIGANVFNVGKMLRIEWAGALSNVVTAQPTFTFQFQLGPTSNITVFSTGALTTSTTAHTNVPVMGEFLLTCRSVGSGTSATLMGQGRVFSQAFVASGATADSANGHTMLLAPNTAPAVGTGFDSTVDNWADLFVACSTSNAGNAFTLHQYALQVLN
jgi:hypothetical protein